ncbi:16469_t:CDS:2, partial [Dentiscutata erythropus]
ETINLNTIQKTNIEHEYIVPSTNENNDILYIVNSKFGNYSCPVGMSDDRTIYAHIALGYIAQDMSFYASLHAQPILQDQE